LHNLSHAELRIIECLNKNWFCRWCYGVMIVEFVSETGSAAGRFCSDFPLRCKFSHCGRWVAMVTIHTPLFAVWFLCFCFHSIL